MSVNSPAPAQRDRAATRRYVLEFFPAVILYLILLFGVSAVVDLKGSNPWNPLLALLPLIPVVWMMVAAIRHYRRSDEYQRGLILRALACGFLAAMLTAVAVALLGTSSVSVAGGEWWIFGAGMATWGVASVVVVRR